MAMRRNARLRREYLYKKSLEGKAKEDYERKERIRKALQEGTAIPTELKHDAEALKKEIELEDDVTSKVRTHIDNEYANAGIRDPKVCVTTSRDPSSRLRQFAAEVRLIFPNAQRINRGGTTMAEIVEAARTSEFTDIVIVQETRGVPDALIVSHLPFGPTIQFTLSNTVLRHDLENVGHMSEAYPQLIFNNFKSPLGERIANILKHLFPVPKEDSTRVVTFSNDADYISFRHHTFEKSANAHKKEEVTLTEMGPRFELHPFKIQLGSADQTDAETEWVLRPYMNTARKKSHL